MQHVLCVQCITIGLSHCAKVSVHHDLVPDVHEGHLGLQMSQEVPDGALLVDGDLLVDQEEHLVLQQGVVIDLKSRIFREWFEIQHHCPKNVPLT